MKKIALCLALVLLFTTDFSFLVNADASKKFDTKVICRNVNSVKSVEITGSTNYTAAGISGTLSVSNGASVSLGTCTLGSAAYTDYNTAADSFSIQKNGNVGFSIMGDLLAGGSSGEWCKINLNNLSDKGSISLTDFVSTNVNGKKLSNVESKLTVCLEWIAGDANGDAKVDILDLVHTKKIAANAVDDNVKYYCNIDFDFNDKIDASDIIEVRKILLNVV